MNESVKDEFRKNQSDNEVVTLSEVSSKRGKGSTVGQHWDKELSKIIQANKADKAAQHQHPTLDVCEPEDKMQCGIRAEIRLLQKISDLFGIQCLDSHFPLYGYMYSIKAESPKVYLWQGDADAVGWYENSGEGRYVIVDWKVLTLLEFWEKNKDAYGKYLHQCLVYARLLQLHLNLNYLPHILIVPIDGVSGQITHPRLFHDYPKECKGMIENFKWSATVPEPAQKISGKLPLFNSLQVGKVDKNMPLTKLFSQDAKVSDLLEEFGWHSLEVTADFKT